MFGLSSIVSASLPGIIIPAVMGIFGTTKHAQWKQLMPLNCAVVRLRWITLRSLDILSSKITDDIKWQVILSNLLYMIFISTEHASWEPAVGSHHKSMDSILER